jgi:hypothetical protein
MDSSGGCIQQDAELQAMMDTGDEGWTPVGVAYSCHKFNKKYKNLQIILDFLSTVHDPPFRAGF